MARILNTKTYPYDTEVNINDFFIGTDSILGKPTKNFRVLDLFNAFRSYFGYTNMVYNDVQDIQHYYYGGYYNRGQGNEWLIIRIPTDNLQGKFIANLGINPTYTNLDIAWNNRLNLTYN